MRICVFGGMWLGLALWGLAEEARPAEEKKEPAPRIKRLEPVAGPVQGGQEVRIFGENFREGCQVQFGEQPVKAENVRVEKLGNLVMVKTPPGRGVVAVQVVNPDGQPGMRPAAYFFGQGAPAHLFRLKNGLANFWFWVESGSWVMYPILFLSFLALALIFHCALAIRQTQLIPTDLVESVAEHLSNGHLDRASELCRKRGCAFGRVILAGIQRSEQLPEIIRDAMGAAGVREADHLHQKIHYLSNVGTIAPMLGLFGTVWGLQLAFQAIAGSAGQSLLLAGAIAVALNTTVAGLLVGIGAYIGYFLFRGKVIRLVSTMEILAEEMAERIVQRKGAEE